MTSVVSPPPPLLYTVRQTAEVLSYSTRTVWRLISAGELTTFKGPGPTRVLAASVAAYIERHKEGVA